MARQATGHVDARELTDGTTAFHIRVRDGGERIPLVLHERPNCECCGGGWDELAVRRYVANTLVKIQAGAWERPEPAASTVTNDEPAAPPYDEYADSWLAAKKAGVIGKKPISPNTAHDYRWRLGYSRAYFGATPVDEIDKHRALGLKAKLLKVASEQEELVAAGVQLRDERGRVVVPLGPASIKKILDTFASVLDEAVEDDYRDDNPARSKRMLVAVPKPERTFLEMDELAALLDAASSQDVALPTLAGVAVDADSTAGRVGRLATQGQRPAQIATALSISKPTVTYHLRRLGIDLGRGYIGRRLVCEVLGRAGLRVSELCDLKIGQIRLHDPEGTRLRVVQAKTEAGERVVEVSPDLAEVIIEHIDRLRRAGVPTGPDAYLIPNSRGGRISRQRIAKIVKKAADLASKQLVEKGLPPLQTTTPHTLRRTYISIALLANSFEVKWVMDQVGHDDSTRTMDVYAQLQRRADRRHGAEYDRLMRRAREQLAGVAVAA
jgi:integrase